MGDADTPISSKLRVRGGEDLLIAGLDPAHTFIDKSDAKYAARRPARRARSTCTS